MTELDSSANHEGRPNLDNEKEKRFGKCRVNLYQMVSVCIFELKNPSGKKSSIHFTGIMTNLIGGKFGVKYYFARINCLCVTNQAVSLSDTGRRTKAIELFPILIHYFVILC